MLLGGLRLRQSCSVCPQILLCLYATRRSAACNRALGIVHRGNDRRGKGLGAHRLEAIFTVALSTHFCPLRQERLAKQKVELTECRRQAEAQRKVPLPPPFCLPMGCSCVNPPPPPHVYPRVSISAGRPIRPEGYQFWGGINFGWGGGACSFSPVIQFCFMLAAWNIQILNPILKYMA